MSSKLIQLNKSGDSLIEVLIAMLVVATVLGGAYASSRNSLNATEVSKERDVALHIAQTQLERIRGYRSVNPTTPLSSNICFDVTPSPHSNSSLPALSSDVLTGTPGAYNASCVVVPSGAVYTPGAQDVPYYEAIEVNANDYIIHVRWARSGGGGNQEAILNYRTY